MNRPPLDEALISTCNLNFMNSKKGKKTRKIYGRKKVGKIGKIEGRDILVTAG